MRNLRSKQLTNPTRNNTTVLLDSARQERLIEAASSVGRSSFTRVLEEIPVVIHNSHLVNILLTEIVDNQELSRSELSTNSSMLDLAPPLPKDHPGRYSTLNLSMASSLEQQLRSLLAGLETVHDYQYSYQRSLSKSQTTVAGKVNQ
ncbi:unnamed protein product [Schistosoma mattheei]|uniref:eIF3h C-terminal domain-containing protein n=1 Tax=Schistosoma mattheei TaxID=31246 RepID=A0A183PGQ4_9TREM|nr:unnamed protein product [Schistosoma mattheei]